MLTLNNLSFSTPERNIIQDISLSIDPEDFVVILGGNGSGKSTLLKLINQTYHQTSGNISFTNKINPKIVTLTQLMSDSLFMDLTVEENALLIESALFKTTPSKKIFLSQLPAYVSQFNLNLPNALKTRVRQLSGGEQQILAFALYLRHKPDLLLLDEHTSALDPKKADAVMAFTNQYLQQHKITCLMTTHSLSYALQYGNRLIALSDGHIIFEADADTKSTLTIADLMRHCY
jgi:putative ABC transport system ATP-binding protein